MALFTMLFLLLAEGLLFAQLANADLSSVPEPAWIKSFSACKAPYPPYPDLRWLDNWVLEATRNQKPEGRTGIIRGNEHKKANKLLNTFLARWSCEVFQRNALHPDSSKSVFKPSGEYSKNTEDLVWHFQSTAGISPPTGWLDLRTLQAMDRWLGIREPIVKNPERLGDPKKGLEIEGKSIAFETNIEGSVVAHIFFPTNGVDLEKDDLDALEEVVNNLDKQGATRIQFKVLGFADKREKTSFNQLLGEKRTASVDEKLREMLTKRKIWNRSIRFYMGEAERPQIGESADALRRFRRVDVILTELSMDPCWHCSYEERKNGVTKGRKGCDLLCPKEPTPPKLCDPDETAKNWSVSGKIGGFCKETGCIMTGDIWINGGPTNKGHFCRAPYAFQAIGGSAGPDIPLVCELAITKLPVESFKTPKPVSFLDYEGSVIFESSGFELGLGYTKSMLRFLHAGKSRGITTPKAVWDWGVSGGGLSCGKSLVTGSLDMIHIPHQK